MNEELLNKRELANELKVSVASVDRYMALGMPRIKIGKNVRFQLSVVLDWFKERGNK